MKHLVSFIAVSAAISGGAAAADFKTACARAGDERVIEILSPGIVGKACDVRYTREAGANIKIPYHADNSAGFCQTKAVEIVEQLTGAGFTCTPVEFDRVAEAQVAPQAVASEPAVIQTAAPQPIAQQQETLSSEQHAAIDIPATPPQSAPAALQETAAPAPESPAPGVAATAEPVQTVAAAPVQETQQPADAPVEITAPLSVASAPAPAHDVDAAMNDILAEPTVMAEAPVAQEAVHGPADLTAEVGDAPAGAPRSSVVGKVVGAEPDVVKPVTLAAAPSASQGVTPVTQTSATVEAPEVKPTVAPAVQPAPKAETKKIVVGQRKPEDVIRATLAAQTAAWNEGDLDAFMETYWKDDDLRFVSGGEVTKGWNTTAKRYKARYGNGASLGQLGFDKLDVKMVTDDVAVIVGRFNLMRAEAADSGVFTLVMKRETGVWRIVHDHTVADAGEAQ